MKPTKNDNLNFNITDQYIQAKKDLGSTTFYNVNTNTSTLVPWGHYDYINFFFSTVFSSALAFGAVYLVGHWVKVW